MTFLRLYIILFMFMTLSIAPYIQAPPSLAPPDTYIHIQVAIPNYRKTGSFIFWLNSERVCIPDSFLLLLLASHRGLCDEPDNKFSTISNSIFIFVFYHVRYFRIIIIVYYRCWHVVRWISS